MKKINLLFVIIIMLCVVLPIKAQMNIGVVGGLNLARINVDPKPTGSEYSTQIAFGFGGVFDYSINEFFELRFEPIYLLKGGKITVAGVTAESKLSYLEIPIMVKYSLVADHIKPYIMAGPTIGYNLNSKIKASMGNISVEQDNKDNTKNVEFCFNIGAGISLPIGGNSIFFEARYSLGLIDIYEASQNDTNTNGIQLFVGLTFPIRN